MSQHSKTSIAVAGATGRMGQRLVALSHKSEVFDLLAAITRAGSPSLAKDAGEIAGAGKIDLPLTFDLKPTPRVLIDFTTPTAMRHWLKTCRDRGIAMVIGTTGLQPHDHDAIDQAAVDIAVLQAPNMSLGVNVLLKVVAQVSAILGDDYDKEIVEAHHRFKKEAPSGTAMALAQAMIKSMGKDQSAIIFDRHGEEVERKRGEIGMHSCRIGDEVGRHTVFFGAPGERLEFTHAATNRDTFAHGALKAAAWLAQQKPGRYSVADLLPI